MKSRFNPEAAAQAVGFFEHLLVHTKSPYDRQPFILAPFQREIVEALFGEQLYDPESEAWVRRYNLAWIETGRKNGKTELMAGIALLLLAGDGEEGAEIYSVAKDREQAAKCFDVARRMLEMGGLGGAPRSGKPFTLYPTNKRIVYYKTNSTYEVIAADALGNLGQNPHGILFDEILAQPDGHLWDALKTGFGTRTQPLMVAVTTAGDDPTSFAQAEHDFSERVATDPDLAPRRYVFMRNAPKDADPADEEVWAHSNPALGHFLRPQVLRDEYHEAFGPGGNARAQRAFRQFRLNQWQDASVDAPITLEEWNASVGVVDETKLKGRRAYGGLHTAYIDDLTALCWVFPPKDPEVAWQALWRFFIPEAGMESLEARTSDYSGGPASGWVKSGLLTVTEGNTIDIPAHLDRLKRDIETFDVAELAFDPNGAIGIVQPVMEAKLCEVVKITGQTGGSVLTDWVRLIRDGEFHHSSNAVMRWQIACLMAREGPDQVPKIDRKGSRDVVPGVIACELALRRGLIAVAKPMPYEEHGMRFV